MELEKNSSKKFTQNNHSSVVFVFTQFCLLIHFQRLIDQTNNKNKMHNKREKKQPTTHIFLVRQRLVERTDRRTEAASAAIKCFFIVKMCM